ncbi:hypothetical protein BDV30DRAFT_237045 [Aspergillus minisclerotigenes]|uniref:Carrier domain-containing protein n=1 Tax=Aspergillus minisclerotigenes TaxID=656917 RepID=A0A5N6J9Q4_9EURO|nr:hypothetical protein BDV30DRAFT_237045 [Aspergillus minisclerotigenes]
MDPPSNGLKSGPQTGEEGTSGGVLRQFDRWVAHDPMKLAILFKNEEISYWELDHRSRQLGMRLKDYGVGLDDIVVFCFPKSVHAIVCMLAILRCGAAFAAILPDTPAPRKKDVIHACQPKVILCGFEQKAMVENLDIAHIVVGNDSWRDLPGLQEHGTKHYSFPMLSDRSAACILFTSGSTGKPKGVVYEHGNIIVAADSWAGYLGIKPGSRVLQWCSFTFDVSVVETIVALTRGACICMPTDEERLQGTEAFVNRVGAEWAFFTPSVARVLDPSLMPGLMTVVLGGEATSKEIVSRWAPNRRLVNSYGPCEATIYFSFAELYDKGADTRNVGTPLPGCSNGYIVSPDDANILLPEREGITGELLIEGPTVVRGYLNDESRSLTAFIETPVWYNRSSETGQVPGRDTQAWKPRFYLTGDLVERCKDGSFRIMGRKDRQVKVRGQKMDLDEIRHHFLSRAENLHDFVALFEGFSITRTRRRHELVAFVVACSAGSTPTRTGVATIATMTDELRADLTKTCEALRKTVPGFMIPTLFIPLTQIPLTTHSKLDIAKLRSFLARLDRSQERLFALYQHDFEPLITENEIIVGEVVSHELGLELEDINGNDGFVQLGGDSIKAMSVATKLGRRGKCLSTQTILLSSTLKRLAVLMEPCESSQLKSLVVPLPFSLLRPGTTELTRQEAAEACGISEEAIHDIFPCSALQEGFLGVSSRDRRANVARYVFNLGPTVDVNALSAAWQATNSAIETLRTRFFLSSSEGLLQVVINDTPAAVFTHKSLTDWLESDKSKPFGLGEPMVRVAHITTLSTNGNAKGMFFVLTIHHAIFDLFTLRLIIQSLKAAYTHQSPPMILPFTVAIAEQREATRVVTSQNFWKAALQDSPVPVWPRPTPTHLLNVESEWARCLRQLEFSELPARLSNKTTATYLQAAWAVLLSAYQGSDDVVFAMAVSGRESDRCDASQIAGPMLASCPLRLRVSHTETVGVFLDFVQKTVAETSRHAHLGIQHIARLGEDEKRACSLQTLLVVQPDICATETLGMDMELDTELTREEGLGSYVCWVECIPRGSQLTLKMEYLRQAMDSGDLILECLGNLFCALIQSHSDEAISSLALFPTEGSKIAHPRHEAIMEVRQETVHDYILNVARNQPEKEAVIGWDGNFTYRQLDQLSGRLALKLRALGVDVGTIVPFYIQKSIWVVVGLLAVLRAGGTTAFLDINSPKCRNQEIIEQLQPSPFLIICSPGIEKWWPQNVKHVVEIGPSHASETMEPGLESVDGGDVLQTEVEPELSLPSVPSESIAYLFFTSGTTGVPKGIEIEHRAYLTAALARLSPFERSAKSRVLQASSFCFDLSIEDMCTTLLAGGTIVMPSEHERINDLAGAINRYAVNKVSLTPSVANLLVPQNVPSLEVLVVGGEVPSEALYDRWTSTRVHLLNAYGPTECSMWTTATRAIHNEPRNIGYVTWGRAWVTHPDNPHIRMPLGAVGELILEGPGLARGYYQNPHATSKAFVNDLQWSTPGCRFYRTGDLVRSNQDGSFTFLRRRDHQVKLRGARIELTEVEAKLLSAGRGVIQEVCVDIMELQGKQTLIALCTVTDPKKQTPWQSFIDPVIQELRTLLPPYMMPAFFVPLDSLPITVTGKRDRKKLQRIFKKMTAEYLRNYAASCLSRASHKSPPSSDSHYHGSLVTAAYPELILARKLWCEVLGLRNETEITPVSNFFDLGGDSVVAMRLVALCRDRHMRQLSVEDIYKRPTLLDLGFVLRNTALCSRANTLTTAITSTNSPPAPFSMLGSWREHTSVLGAIHEQLPDVEIEDVYPCTKFQEGIMALSSQQPGSYVARYRFALSSVDLAKVWYACREVVAGNPILRTRIIYVDGFGYFQAVQPPEKSEERSTTVLGRNSHDILVRPWEQGSPLLQFELITDFEPELWCYASHAIFDAFTWDLLYKQLKAAYRSMLQPSMMVPYATFVAYAHAKRFNDAKSQKFWSEYLESAENTNLFAETRQIERIESSQSFEVDIETPNSDRASTKERLAHFTGITDATLLHAAWALTTSAYCLSEDVVFGSVVSERYLNILEGDKIMGPCVATVPLRYRLDRAANLHDWLRHGQQQLIEVVSHAHLGLTKISHSNQAACKFDTLISIFPASADQRLEEDAVKPLSSEPAYDNAAGYYSYPLVLEVQSSHMKLLIRATFDSAVVSPSLVASVVNSFCHTYQQLRGADPHATLAHIDIPQESRTVPELISRWAQLNPHKIGIEAWDGVLSYNEIERYSSKLAVYIQNNFAIPSVEDVIAVCFARSRWVPVVMLAIQKLRRAYIALDPSHPTRRLSQLTQQVGATIVLSDAKQAGRFSNIKTLVIDQPFMDELPLPGHRESGECVQPDDPAVVVYTSGSTGVPKAIIIQQKALANAITGFGPLMDFGQRTRTLQNAAFAFDIHACEIFLTLAHGGCLIITDADPAHLVKTIRSNEINWLFMTPSTMYLLSGPHEVPSVRTLMMIGEAPTRSIVEKWTKADQQLHLINAYGPAENTLFSTMYSFRSPNDDPTNIGTGVNTLTWVVSPWNTNLLLPVGCIGELVLQGPQLAREYLSQPDETSKSFIGAPSWAREAATDSSFGDRFYKTGDLVRYEPDGTLRFVCRVDSQVKLNGQRLELAEVEYYVSQFLPSVRTVADIVEPRGGTPTLAVFVDGAERPSASSPTAIDNAEPVSTSVIVTSGLKQELATCRAKLYDCLPSFMIPALFIPVNRLPQTPSKKLDRKALRGMVSGLTFQQLNIEEGGLSNGRVQSSSGVKEPPATHAQSTLQKLWAKVLGLPISEIGIDDNFFSMGGDSIRAIRLATLMSPENPHRLISTSVVFQKPLLRDMAIILEPESSNVHPKTEVSVNPPLPPVLDLINGTTQEREELLQYCANSLGLSAASIQDIYPCTPLQEAMLAASALSPNAYMAEHSWTVPSSTDLGKLEDAWRRTIEKFDILRTAFMSIPSRGTLQVVSKPATHSKVFQRSEEDSKALSTIILTRSDNGEYKLEWRAHHALFDQWTLVMVKEAVEKFYNGMGVPDIVQFKTFIGHLMETSSSQNAIAHHAYWDNYLHGVAPTPFPNKPERIIRSPKQHRRIKIRTSIRAAHAVTAGIIGRAAWALVLSQYTNADTVVFGTTLSGRNATLPDIESVCGPTITTVPLRVNIPKNQNKPIGSFLRTLQDEAVLMMPHEHHDLQESKKRLSQEVRDLYEFQNILVVQSDWTSGEDEGGAILQPVEDESPTSEYHTVPLAINYNLNRENSMLEAIFDEDAISPVQMTRILRQIEHVANQLQTLGGESTVDDIDYLSVSDRRELAEWNRSKPELVSEYIDQLISRQSVLRPHAQAICAHDGNLTYAQFDDLSQKLANLLVTEHNIGSGDIVPLCFEKSLWAMVAMVGVLKSGAAFVPTDPAQSSGRLREIVHQVQPRIMLVSEETISINFATSATRIILNSSTLERVVGTAIPRDLSKSRSTADLAYIIFTSGSTGKPKGVMIQHRAYCTGARPRKSALARSQAARVIQFATFSFDTSIEDTLTTWGYGACVCIPSEWERLNDLEGAMNRMGVTCAHITPSLADALTPANLPTLQQLHFGGEKMTARALQRWASEDGAVDVRNVYGPTESSITTSATSRLAPGADASNIGFPIGCNVWITDVHDHDRLMPIGCVGELLIEGHVLAKGYLNNPEKTTQAFIVNPRWALQSIDNSDNSRRFYKTGDVAKYADDGSIVCLGRKDAQINLNGYRIELGDVETNLRNILDERVDGLAVEVIVPKKNNPRSTPLLVAFISVGSHLRVGGLQHTESEPVMDGPEAKRALTTILSDNKTMKRLHASVPSYMVPTAFVPIYSIPQSIAKKTDRAALQRLVAHLDAQELRSFVEDDFCTLTETATIPTETRTGVQPIHLIQELCSTVLGQGKDKVNMDHSFIRLGGDSILALRFVAAARRQGFNDLTVADTLRARSLSELATNFYQPDDETVLGNPAEKPTISSNVTTTLPKDVAHEINISPEDIVTIQPATGFQRFAFEASLLPERGYMNTFSFTFLGPVHLHRLEHACERLIARHGSLRTVFIEQEGNLYQIVLRHRLPDEPRLIVKPVTSIKLATILTAEVPEPGYGKPLVRFSLYQGGSASRLVICLSHALYDGTSLANICHDLSTAYLGLSLTAPAPQFHSFITELSQRKEAESQQFWKRLLQGSKMTDIVTRSDKSNNIGAPFKNTEDSEASVRIRCPGNDSTFGFTFASLLKAAWALVLARNSGTDDVVFGHVVTTRGLVCSSTENMVGPCLEFIPVRVNVSKEGLGKGSGGAAMARKLLELVHNQHLDGMPHHAYGFPNIVCNCTEWSSSTRFNTFVQHRSSEERSPEIMLQDGLTAYAMVKARLFGACDLWIVTTPLGGDEIDIAMTYCKDVMREDRVRMLLHELVAELHHLRLLVLESQC